MKLKTTVPKPLKPLTCSVCGTTESQLSKYRGGYVCNDCAEGNRAGSSTTTKALRSQQRANRAAQSLVLDEEGLTSTRAQLEYIQTAGQLLAADSLAVPVDCIPLAGGEVAAFSDARNTKLTTCIVSLEASNERVRLISSLGHDISALALDTADAVGAIGSIEQMLAHQVAAAHHQAMTLLARAAVEPDLTMQLQYSSLAAKWMATMNSAVLTLKKLKANGEQRITIQHVNVSDGGQAVIGDVQTGGVK